MGPASKDHTDFRRYPRGDAASGVREHYRKMRSRQTVAYNQRVREKYLDFKRPMGMWEVIEKLNQLVDVSDPDVSLPNAQHGVQSAAAVRRDQGPDWLELVALIHDAGKILFLWGCEDDGTSPAEQWGIVGDTFVVGCRLPDTCVYPELNPLNPDMEDERYSTVLGCYQPGCGLDRVTLSWGHDEYLYQVLSHHRGNRLPEQAMAQIRYHSFYPWHREGSYRELMGPKDGEYLEWVHQLNTYDLYSKSDEVYDLNEVEPYYTPLIERYLGNEPILW